MLNSVCVCVCVHVLMHTQDRKTPPSKVTAELEDEQKFAWQRGKECSERGAPRSRADAAARGGA